MVSCIKFSLDTFPNGLCLKQPLLGFRAGTDSLLLAKSLSLKSDYTNNNISVLDVGSGAGAVSLSILLAYPNLSVTGLEVQSIYSNLSQENAMLNALDGRYTAINGDLQDIHKLLMPDSFDFVLTNPPYYKIGSGYQNRDPKKILAHHGSDLVSWVKKSLYPLKNKGTFIMICRTQRLGDIYKALDDRAGDVTIIPIASGSQNQIKRVIISCKKGTRGETSMCTPIEM